MKRFLSLLLALLFLFTAGCTARQVPAAEAVSPDLDVYFLDVGQGDSALILCGGHAMLIDGGNAADGELVSAFLTQKGVNKLDYVVATHAHEDHVGGLTRVLQDHACETVYAPVTVSSNGPFKRFAEASERYGGVTRCLRGTTGQVGEATFRVLWPVAPEAETNVNNTSIVLKLTLGRVSFLFTGDMERDAESRLSAYGDDLTSAVLKVGHHGSSGSTGYLLLRSVMPQFAVISCGQNNDYGHPHASTIDILTQAEADIWRTDTMGTIEIKTDGERLCVSTKEKSVTVPLVLNTPALQKADYYIGNKKSLVYHLPSCASLPSEQNRVRFSTREEAEEAGYHACSVCRP